MKPVYDCKGNRIARSIKSYAEKKGGNYNAAVKYLHRNAVSTDIGFMLKDKSKKEKNQKKPKKKSLYKILSELSGLDYMLLYSRINRRGWSIEDALTTPVNVPVFVDGKEFRNQAHAFEEMSRVKFPTFLKRKEKDYTIEQSLGIEPIYKYTVFGERYENRTQVAKAYGISYQTLNTRMRAMSIEEAVIFDSHNGRYNERYFEKHPEIAKAKGILYVIDIDEFKCKKIGITKNNISKRFPSEKVSPILEVNGRMIDIYRIEQDILKKYKSFRKRGPNDFDGKTELLDIEGKDLKKMLKDIRMHC